MKKIFLVSMCILISITLYHTIYARCTVGVVAGEASFDGRPIAFKNRDYTFAYQGVVYVSSGTYKYIGIGNSGSSALMGLNEKGVGLGNSVMDDLNGGAGNVTCMDWLLKNCTTVDECRTALENDTYSGSTPSFSLPIVGMNGKTYHIEKGANYYEYDPLDYGPSEVRKYAVIVRTNNGHMNNDGSDDETTGGKRYYEARDHLHNAVIKNGIFDSDPADTSGVTLAEVFQTLRWGNPGYEGGWTDPTSGNCNGTSLSTMIVHGVNQNEDPKIAVMWSTVYKADYIAFVPVWVEIGIQGDFPTRIVVGNDAQGLSYQAHRIYNEKDENDYDQYVNTRYIPMETNFIQAVSDARERWAENGFVYEEAKRMCDESVETTYWTLKTMADQAQSNPRDLNETPLITEINEDVQNNTATLSHNASDPDGTIDSAYWEFGDGQTSIEDNPTHVYSSEGTYLVMCRVIDNEGSRNSRWKYITVGGVDISVAGLSTKTPSGLLNCIPSGQNVSFIIQLNRSGEYRISVYNLRGQQVWDYSSSRNSGGIFNVNWNCNNSRLGNKVYIAKYVHNVKQSVQKFTIAR